MTIDGFLPEHKEPFVAFSRPAAERFHRTTRWIARRLHASVEGVERIPRGRAILVANHAFGWDLAFAMTAIHDATGRDVWALGEHLWWKVPIVRRAAAAVGVVDGTPGNADRLLGAGELVLVLPGGLREAVKPRELRYRLLWGHRYGFVRAAIRNGAPMVPVASIGADEIFDFIGDALARGERLLHRRLPVPRPVHLVPLPHRTRLRIVVGEPIVPDAPPERENDFATLRRLRLEVEGALAELLDAELARRAGVTLD